jgi:general secretion pathway protein F
MPSFRYKAMTTGGTITSGVLDAASQADAIAQVQRLGHFPLAAAEGAASAWRKLLPQGIWPERALTPAVLAAATQGLATLLKAGLPLDRALKFVAELEENRPIHARLLQVLGSVRDGAGLGDSLAGVDGFPKSYVAMVRAGEHGGNLEPTLQRLADYLARSSAIREAVISALVYPAMLLCTAGVSIVIVLVFVLPQFAPLFAQSGKPLPWSTQLVMDAGAFLSATWWLLLVFAIAGVLVYRRAMKAAPFRRMRDDLLLRLPLVGALLRKAQVERFSRSLGTLLANGVALPQALSITADALSNSVIAAAVRAAATGLKEGEQLSTRLRQSGVFPAVALDLVRVGEETGSLDEMLLRQADLYEREVKHAVDRLLTLMVPLLTVFMGMIVAGLIASILLAIQSVNDLAI